ncbi:MAG: N-acetyltransferase [Caldilinea sp. CFX5]|nr:N-acetyltransferase [Caldilinea sp. CFX5]
MSAVCLTAPQAVAPFGWDAVPPLRTPRLDLRALTPADRADLFAIYGDAAVMVFTSDPAFPDLTYVDQMLASVARLFAERASLEWGVGLRAAGRIIGTCGLHSFDQEAQCAEIGCILGRAYWGQGLMREALSAVIAFGFDGFNLQTIKADIDAPNHRSFALFQRLGFAPAGAGSTILIRRRQQALLDREDILLV